MGIMLNAGPPRVEHNETQTCMTSKQPWMQLEMIRQKQTGGWLVHKEGQKKGGRHVLRRAFALGWFVIHYDPSPKRPNQSMHPYLLYLCGINGNNPLDNQGADRWSNENWWRWDMKDAKWDPGIQGWNSVNVHKSMEHDSVIKCASTMLSTLVICWLIPLAAWCSRFCGFLIPYGSFLKFHHELIQLWLHFRKDHHWEIILGLAHEVLQSVFCGFFLIMLPIIPFYEYSFWSMEVQEFLLGSKSPGAACCQVHLADSGSPGSI